MQGPSHTHRLPSGAALTLLETLMGMTVIAIALGGLLASLLQARRLAEASLAESVALSTAENYMAQLKRMPLSAFANASLNATGNQLLPSLSGSYSVPTSGTSGTGLVVNDPLRTSPGTPPSLAQITPGTTPSGVVDNLLSIPLYPSAATGAQADWTEVWPGAAVYPAASPCGRTDLHLDLWLWITDLSASAGSPALGPRTTYGITLIVTWQVQSGGQALYHSVALHGLRSSVAL